MKVIAVMCLNNYEFATLLISRYCTVDVIFLYSGWSNKFSVAENNACSFFYGRNIAHILCQEALAFLFLQLTNSMELSTTREAKSYEAA
jgi:hypothetical protein